LREGIDEVLGEFTMRCAAYENEHPSAVFQDGGLFEGTIADLLVVGQDIPAARGHLWYPHPISRVVGKMIDVAFDLDAAAA